MPIQADPTHSPMKQHIAERLAEARARTLLLVAPLSAEDGRRQHNPLMSPILWDVGHIVHFEQLWLAHNLSGPIEFSEMPGLYNPAEHPRSTRAMLPLPSLAELLRLAADIRTEVLQTLRATDPGSHDPLLLNGFVYNMVLQHEYQHNETILQTLQLKQGEPYHAPRIARPEMAEGAAVARFNEMVRVPSGEYTIGSNDRSNTYDNERPAHTVHLNAFDIDESPVTNAAYQLFMDDNGYKRDELWSAEGRAWLAESAAEAPQYWEQRDDAWFVRSMDVTAPVAPDHPVCHVCYHEAEAFARWTGKRLPTEIEWEIAASWDPSSGTNRLFPWGDDPSTQLRANVDQLTFGTAAVGAYPSNVSPFGCYGMIGDVWEWTSTDFSGYPGFTSFPYPEYSEAFFGTQYKVLRGGSWATRSGAVRSSFRNWDFPIRRQIFSGFRCARDV